MASFGNSPTFIPTQISNCALWLDAADSNSVITNGSTITRVLDKSSQNVFLSNASNFTYPNNIFNGRYPSFFNNAGGFSTGNIANLGRNALFSYSIPFTVFFVAQQTAIASDYGYIIDSVSGAGRPYILGIALNTSFGNGASTSNRPFLACTQFYSSAAMIINGTTSYTGSIASLTTGGLIIGNRFTINEAWPGHICEFIIYNRSVQTSERQQVEGYLAWKWGLQSSLPTSHPYFTSPILLNTRLPSQLTTPFFNSGTSVFDPRSLPNCALWLDAANTSTMTFSGNSILQWNDKSGNGRNFTTTSGTPTYFSTRDGVYFSAATTDIMATSVTVPVTGSSSVLFVSVRVTGSIGANGLVYLINFGNSTNDLSLRVASAGTNFNTADICFSQQFYVNGNLSINATPSGTFNNVTLLNGTINLTRNTILQISTSYLNRYLIGFFQEFILFSSPITNAQRQQIEAYLTWKWGAQNNLPTSHPYYNNPIVPNITLSSRIVTPLICQVGRFSPLSITGAVIWLDAADTSTYTASNNSVTTITNKGTSGGSITQTGTGTVLVNQLFQNNLTLLTLNSNGSSSDLTSPTINLTSPIRSLFIIAKPGTSGNQTLVNNGAVIPNGGGPQFYLFNSQLQFNRLGAVILRTTVLNNFLDTFGLYNATNTVNDRGIYINGSSSSLNINTTTTFISGNTNFTFGAQLTTIHIGEVIIYDNSLTTNDRQQIEGYLAWKWGLQSSLPSSHPYVLFPPN